MKRLILSILLAAASFTAFSQVPFFGATCGDGMLNGYYNLKSYPGDNRMANYSMVQYGIGDHFAIGADYTWAQQDGVANSAHFGLIARYGHVFSQWFKAGFMATPYFNLLDGFRYKGIDLAFFINGDLSRDGKFFWCSNTFADYFKGNRPAYSNYWYLGCHFKVTDRITITPMAGITHNWDFSNADLNPVVGVYYSYKRINVYVWGDRFRDKFYRHNFGLEFLM